MRFFTPASASSWRLSFAGGAYSPPPQVQIAALGLSRGLPRGVVAGYNSRGFRPSVTTSRTAKGAPLGRLTRQALRSLRLGQPYLLERELDALRDLEQHACKDMLPFFLSWDPGEHVAEAAFVWASDSVVWAAPLERIAGELGTKAWALDLEAVAT